MSIKCPRCLDTEIRPSYTAPLERLASTVLPLSPYRCRLCRHRFWGLDRPVLNLARGLFLGGLGLVVVVSGIRFFGPLNRAEAEVRSAEAGPIPKATSIRPPGEAGGSGSGLGPSGDVGRSGLDPSGPNSSGPGLPRVGSGRGVVAEGAGAELEEDAWPRGDVIPKGEAAQGASASRGDAAGFGGDDVLEELVRASNESSGPGAFTNEASALGTAAPQIPAEDVAEPPVVPPPASVRSSVPRPVEAPFQGELRRLRAVERSGSLEIEVIAGEPLDDFRSFSVESPRRFVVDLPGAWSSSLPNDLVMQHYLARSVRVGLHRGKLRLVVDLMPDAMPEPQIEPHGRGLMIKISPAPLQPLPL